MPAVLVEKKKEKKIPKGQQDPKLQRSVLAKSTGIVMPTDLAKIASKSQVEHMQPKGIGLSLSGDNKIKNTDLIEDYFQQGKDMQRKIRAD